MTRAGNGVRSSVVFTGTVWSEMDAYDRLPAPVRVAMRNLKIPISPSEVDQALQCGASVAEILKDLRMNDAYLMTFGAHSTRSMYGESHPEACRYMAMPGQNQRRNHQSAKK